MGPWRSRFELVVPECTPAHLAQVARAHGGRRTKVGLIVRVRDGHIRARYNELSRASTAPLLKGALLQEPVGTRIVGEIQWTNVLIAPFSTLAVALVCIAVGLVAAAAWSVLVGAFVLLGGLGFVALSVKEFRGEGTSREYEESRLRAELLSTFAKHHHR